MVNERGKETSLVGGNRELTFEGTFKDGNREQGKELYSRGLIFEGSFKDNLKWDGYEKELNTHLLRMHQTDHGQGGCFLLYLA